MHLKLIENANDRYHVDEEGRMQGEYHRRYRNGQRQVRSFYVDDVAEGLFRSWHVNGVPCVNCIMKNDHPHGEYVSLLDNGEVCEHSIHIDGEAIAIPDHIDITNMTETDMFELKLLHGDIGFLCEKR